MKPGDCYWYASECRNGHLVGCPVSEFALDPRDPWAEQTTPRSAQHDPELPAERKPTYWRIVGDA